MREKNRKWAYALVILGVVSLAQGSFYLLGQQPPGGQERLVSGPMIQDVQKDRATITWVTQQGGLAVKKASEIVYKSLETKSYHRIDLSKLQAGTRYDYRLSQFGEGIKGSFQTAPDEKDAAFVFVVVGDTRTRDEVHTKSTAKVLAEQPAFVLHTGDLVANGRDPAQWDTFFDIEKDLLRNIPFYPVPGNHENNAADYFKYFVFPGGNGHHYSFDWGYRRSQTGLRPGTGRMASTGFEEE